MSKDLNQCNFIGRMGKDPEAAATNNGKTVVNFSIACGDDYKDKQGNKVEQTNWINVVAFDRLAEIIGQYCSKGSKVYISGKQVTRKWQDKQGQDRYTTEIVANNMQMLDSKNDNQMSGQSRNRSAADRQSSQQEQQQSAADDWDDDIPF